MRTIGAEVVSDEAGWIAPSGVGHHVQVGLVHGLNEPLHAKT